MPKDTQMTEAKGIVIVSEAECQRLVGRKEAFDAVEADVHAPTRFLLP